MAILSCLSRFPCIGKHRKLEDVSKDVNQNSQDYHYGTETMFIHPLNSYFTKSYQLESCDPEKYTNADALIDVLQAITKTDGLLCVKKLTVVLGELPSLPLQCFGVASREKLSRLVITMVEDLQQPFDCETNCDGTCTFRKKLAVFQGILSHLGDRTREIFEVIAADPQERPRNFRAFVYAWEDKFAEFLEVLKPIYDGNMEEIERDVTLFMNSHDTPACIGSAEILGLLSGHGKIEFTKFLDKSSYDGKMEGKEVHRGNIAVQI